MLINIRKKLKLPLPRKLDNEGGAVLIISMFVLTILFGLTACFSVASVSELKASNRYFDSAEAFWTAEAAINRFIQNPTLLDDGDLILTIDGISVDLSKDDITDPLTRVVTAKATANGVERSVSVNFPAATPDLFSNTLSSGGDAAINGFWGTMDFDGQSRLTGTYQPSNGAVSMTFDDLGESVASSETTLGYTDVDGNGTADEFNDFVEYNRRLTDVDDPNFTGDYTDSEVIYYPSNDLVEIWPDDDLIGVKVIFIEGSAPGEGDVDVYFNSTWAADQNMTIVSTGSVTYLQPLETPSANSKLNTISWDDYNEGTIFHSSHAGATYTHGSANFGSIASISSTDGALIANDGVDAFLIGVRKEFNYVDPIDSEGLVPPGFQGLTNGTASSYSSTPNNWAEVWEVTGQ